MTQQTTFPSRRTLLRGAAALAAAPLAGLAGHHAFAQATPLKQRQTIKLAWGQTAVCQSPISVALKQGLFEKYNLAVEPVNFSSLTRTPVRASRQGSRP